MALQVFECGVCLENICGKSNPPHVIDETLVCYDCLKESVLPMFQAALKYENQYPPRFGLKKLEINGFADLLSRHFGLDFVERYVRREIEYAATIRIYCKHLVDARHLPAVGGVCPGNTKLALTPGMVEIYKAAGNTQTQCGGFVSGRVHPLQTILGCDRCKGKLCGACEQPIFPDIDSHTCKAVHRADTLEDLIGQRRGRDIQQCPNTRCRSITGLLSELEADFRSTLQSVVKSYQEGLFEVRAIDASPDINAWAMANGFDLDDEPVVRLMRMYDDLAANIMFADRIAETHPSPEETEEFHHRHIAIIQQARRVDRDLTDGAFPELKSIYDDYMDSIPAWQWY